MGPELEDISSRKDGTVLKRQVKPGNGELLPDASVVRLLAKSVTAGGSNLIEPTALELTIGNGEVCDALECACCHLSPGEEAIITCKPSLAVDDALSLQLPENLSDHVEFRVVMMDCIQYPPDKKTMTESDRLKLVLERKAVAARLFREGRPALAVQRYSGIVNFLDYPDQLFSDEATRAHARELKLVCQLNRAACLLKTGDAKRAAVCCTGVLAHDPRNAKALFRRASAHIEMQMFDDALGDIRQCCEIQPQNKDARRLLQGLLRRGREAEKLLFSKMASQLSPNSSEGKRKANGISESPGAVCPPSDTLLVDEAITADRVNVKDQSSTDEPRSPTVKLPLKEQLDIDLQATAVSSQELVLPSPPGSPVLPSLPGSPAAKMEQLDLDLKATAASSQELVLPSPRPGLARPSLPDESHIDHAPRKPKVDEIDIPCGLIEQGIGGDVGQGYCKENLTPSRLKPRSRGDSTPKKDPQDSSPRGEPPIDPAFLPFSVRRLRFQCQTP